MLIEKDNILRILSETKKAVKDEDSIKLKELSNQTIHSASIHQDEDCITIAVIVYSLSKLLERTNYKDYNKWNNFFSSFMKHIDRAYFAVKNNDKEKFRFEIKKLRKTIAKLTGNFKKHVEDVFKKAEINKASRIYEHGISMEKTAKLLGITIWDLASYVGQTGIGDADLSLTMPEKERIKIAQEMFEK